jgi:AMMECR1 domain-containing protein
LNKYGVRKYVSAIFSLSLFELGCHKIYLCSRETPQIHGAIESPSDYTELKATDEMCLHCFDVLLKYILQEKMTSQEVDFLHTLSPNIICPLFVTWDIRKMNGKSKSVGSTDNDESGEANDTFILRGCIGSLAPKTLKSALGEYALASALRDGRFRPIVQNEVPLLRVAVSLLVKYEEFNHAHDWEVGTHGIIIKFSHGNIEYSGRWISYEEHFILWLEITHSIYIQSSFSNVPT